MFARPEWFIFALGIRHIVEPGTHFLKGFRFAKGYRELDGFDGRFYIVVAVIRKIIWIDEWLVVWLFGIETNSPRDYGRKL
jgi:hypothetical protein